MRSERKSKDSVVGLWVFRNQLQEAVKEKAFEAE